MGLGDASVDSLLQAVDHVPLAITLIAAIAEGEARETHRREARQAWSGLDRQDLTGMAASDGIGSADLEALFRADG